MSDSTETPAQGALRVLAITGLVLTGLGAALVFAVGWKLSTGRAEREYFGEPLPDVALLLRGYGVAFVGACVATVGLVKRLPLLALVGAVGQASGAILVQATLEARDSDSHLTYSRLIFAGAILVDIAVVISAWHIHRRSKTELEGDAA
jgi:hypothetical protein